MKMDTGSVFRAANLPVHPLDFRATLAQIRQTLQGYEEQLDGLVDLAPTHALIRDVEDDLERFYAEAGQADSIEAARGYNEALLRVGRPLVRVLYSRDGAYRQDAADHIPLLPEFGQAAAKRGSLPNGVMRTELMRARNRVDGALLDVRDVLGAALA